MAGDASYNSVKLLLHGDGTNGSTTFTDSSSAAKAVTPTSCTISTAQSKFGGASMAFNGTSSRLSVPDSADWNFGTGDFTVEMFARFTAHTSIMALVGNYLNATTGWVYQWRNDTNSLRFGNGDPVLAEAAWIPTNGVWYHLAACRSGTSLRIFVDGAQVGSTATDSTNITGSTNPLLVGSLYFGTYMQFFGGHIDDLRVTKGVARYTSNFTPPGQSFASGLGEVAGVIRDASGALASRTVRLIHRDTGVLLNSAVSDATTGAYRLATPTLDEVVRIVHSNTTTAPLENDLIDRVVPA